MSALLLLIGDVAYGVAIPSAIFALLLAIVLGAAAFACVAFAVSTQIRAADAAAPVTNLTVLPLYFISGVFVPTRQIPPFLRDIAEVFPIYHLAKALRQPFVAPHGAAIAGTDLLVARGLGHRRSGVRRTHVPLVAERGCLNTRGRNRRSIGSASSSAHSPGLVLSRFPVHCATGTATALPASFQRTPGLALCARSRRPHQTRITAAADDPRQHKPSELRLLLSPGLSERVARRGADEWASSRLVASRRVGRAPALARNAEVTTSPGIPPARGRGRRARARGRSRSRVCPISG